LERTRCPAPADRYEPSAHFDDRQLLVNDRFAHFAVVAAREAVRDAGLPTPDDGRTAVIFGIGNGEMRAARRRSCG